MNRYASILVLLSMLFLVACTDVASTCAQVCYNRQSLRKNFGDQFLTRQVYQALYLKTDEFEEDHISIATYHGEVLLAGQTLHAEKKAKAEQIVKSIPGVCAVYNLLDIASPSSSLTRMNDGWITAKIKTKLMVSDDLDGSQVKVLTENGTVYLMGMLTSSDANAAVDLARSTDGVLRVVKMFSYVTISKHPEKETETA